MSDQYELKHARMVRRAAVILLITPLAALGLVAAIAVSMAKTIARDDAVADAIQTARSVGETLFVPILPRLLQKDPDAVRLVHRGIEARDGATLIVRVKVWTRDGVVVYSDDDAIVGKRFPHDEVRAAIDTAIAAGSVSSLEDAEQVDDRQLGDRLVEAYVPITLDDGRKFAFEIYLSDRVLRNTEHELVDRIVTLSLLALGVLVVLQVPMSAWLLRRVGRGGIERANLLRRILAVSENERRRIAHDLHDGALQRLAGAGFALESLLSRMPAGIEPGAVRLMAGAGDAVQASMHDLRSLTTEIYPADLDMTDMQRAIDALAEPLRTESLAVKVTVEPSALAVEAPPAVTGLLYRCARECLANVAKHARAQRVLVDLRAAGTTLVLTVEDDGAGFSDHDPGGPDNGHFGLRLLEDAVHARGGRLTKHKSAHGGARVRVAFSLEPNPQRRVGRFPRFWS